MITVDFILNRSLTSVLMIRICFFALDDSFFLEILMEGRLGSMSSSLSLNTVDIRGNYYSLPKNDNLSLKFPPNLTPIINGGRIQQRHKLLTDGLVQICRVPHAKNIIEKIRFSRFLRRWEDHSINLTQNEISSEIVRRCFSSRDEKLISFD